MSELSHRVVAKWLKADLVNGPLWDQFVEAMDSDPEIVRTIDEYYG